MSSVYTPETQKIAGVSIEKYLHTLDFYISRARPISPDTPGGAVSPTALSTVLLVLVLFGLKRPNPTIVGGMCGRGGAGGAGCALPPGAARLQAGPHEHGRQG